MKSSILRTTLLIIATFLFYVKAHSQVDYQLSRQDSAIVIKYLEQSQSFDNCGDKKEASRFLDLTAMVFWEHNQYSKAIEYYQRSLKLNESLANENGAAMINNNLAMLYSDMKNYDKAVEHFNKTLAARRSNKEKVGMISALVNLSVVLNNMKQYSKSIDQLQEALVYARELNDPVQMKSCYAMLAETYEKAGDNKQFMHYFDLYRTFHEMIQEEKVTRSREDLENERLKLQLVETEKRNQELELYYKQIELRKADSTKTLLLDSLTHKELVIEVMKRDAEIKQLQAAQDRITNQAKIEQGKRNTRVAIGIILFVLIIAGILLFAFHQKRKANKLLEAQNAEIKRQQVKILEQNNHLATAYTEIEEKNMHIMSSLNYARLIQSSMLSRREGLVNYLPESFIFFKPRDIVSGDFYWYARVDNKVIVAALDCTGHGVSGAFLSMIGNNLLTNIIENQGITDPAVVLRELNKGIIVSLNQQHTGNLDGMDLTICVIDAENKKLEFAGAKNPLFLIQNGTLQVIKSDKQSVGGYYSQKDWDREYSKSVIKLTGNDYFYIFSDGFIDQFGGPDNRKYMLAQFKQFILNNYTESMHRQREIFEAEFERWKQKRSQIDDILIIGGIIKC